LLCWAGKQADPDNVGLRLFWNKIVPTAMKVGV
jgi:hypothetical protein